MKLHLPKMLTAALLAALAVSSAYAGDIDQRTTLNLDDGITYNGKIWTLSGTGNFSGRTRTEYIAVGDHMEQGTATTPWGSFASNQSQTWGHTLRLTSTSSDATATTDFSPYSLGGLIVEEGTGTHTFGRAGSKGEFNGVGDVNLHIKGSATILGNSDPGITFYKGGKWLVEEGKLLTLSSTSKVTLSDGIAVNVAGKGSVSVAGNLVTGVGATILVDEGSTFGVTGTTTLGGTITNNGAVSFGGAVTLTSSLSGFEADAKGHYVDHTGADAQNGYYQGTTDYTIVKGNAASGLTTVTHGGKQYAVTDGKITVGSASDTDWTTYHLLTSGASVNVGTEKGYHAELVKVIQSAGTTVDLGGATLATLEGSTSGAAMKLAGTGTITALTKTGELDMQSGASVTVPNLNVTSDMGTYSTGAGQLVIDTVTTNNNGVIEFDSATKLGTVHMTGGNVTFGGTGLHEVTTLGLSQTGTQISTVNVAKDATLHIVGTAVAYDRDTRFSGSFSLSHWNAANVVDVYGTLISDVVVSSCDGTGTINVYEGGRLEMRDGLNRGKNNDNAITINVENGATLAAGTTHNTEQTKDSNNMVVSLAGGSTLEAYYGNDSTAIINKTLTFGEGTVTIDAGAEGKTMTLNSNLTAGVTIDKTGEGELVLAGTGNVLGHAITLSEGTLTMTGTFNIDALEVSGEKTTWERAEGIAEGSGFKKVSGTITVVNKDDSTTLNAAGATVNHEGERVALADTGVVTLGGTANYTTLWVNNTGAVSYNVAQTLAGEVKVGTVHLNYEGATVTMDKADAAVDIVVADGVNAGVKATQNTTINSITGPVAGKTLSLGGTGAVAIGTSDTKGDATLNGAGTLELTGGTVTIHGTNKDSFTGNVDVQGGTLKLGESTGEKYVLGAYNYNTDRTIIVREGATLDLNGQADGNYVYTLDGGRITNTGNALGMNSSQTVGLKLTADSYVGGDGSNDFWLRQRTNKGNTKIELGQYNLTKEGGSTLGLYDTAVTGSGSLVVKDGTVNFNGGTIASNVVLNGGSITGSISAEGEISLTAQQESTLNGLTLLSGQVDIIGTVNVRSNSLDLSSGNKSTGTIHVTDEGVLNVGSTLWMCSNSKIEVEDGGELNIAGLTITSSGEVVSLTSNGNQQYGTGNAKFTIAKATVTSTGDNVTLGNALTDVSVVVADGSSLTLNSNADSVTVNGGGTFTKGTSAAVGTITVEDGGTIAGGVDTTGVTIKAGATGKFDEGITDEEAMIYIGNAIGGSPTITNKGKTDAKYAGLQDESMSVTADFLESYASGDSPVVVKNELFVESIAHEGTGALTLAHVNADALEGVYAYDGALSLQNITEVSLTEMTIAPEATVAVYQGDVAEANQEGTVTIKDTLTAGGATLLANLTMSDLNQDGELLLNVNGGNDNALTLGSAFKIEGETLVNLDQATLSAIAGLTEGQEVVLIKALQENGHELTSNLQNGALASLYFNGVDAADYTMVVNANEIAIKKAGAIPEPTTGTLSLLALAGLCARRRRK